MGEAEEAVRSDSGGECSLASMVPNAQEVKTGAVDMEEMVMLLEE